MKFSVVTPCFNASELILDTALSIANQRLDFDQHAIEYIVVDGGSTDGTIDAIRENWPRNSPVSLTVISEPDMGMYDALSKGFRLCSGEVWSYLNAGDYYSTYAISTVEAVFSDPRVQWLTGMRTTYTAEGVINSAKVPHSYNRLDIRRGFHGIRGNGRFIQQESTFWRRRLMDGVDFATLRRLRLAGDLYLWTRFAATTDLDIVAAHLGGFRFHGGHLSDAMDSYRSEALSFLDTAPWWALGRARAPLNEVLSWVPVPLRHCLPRGSDVFAWEAASDRWLRLRDH